MLQSDSKWCNRWRNFSIMQVHSTTLQSQTYPPQCMDTSSPPSIYAPAETIADRILARCRVVTMLPGVFVLDC